jgi:hypothetical protein
MAVSALRKVTDEDRANLRREAIAELARTNSPDAVVAVAEKYRYARDLFPRTGNAVRSV